jgi:hypothetical protein
MDEGAALTRRVASRIDTAYTATWTLWQSSAPHGLPLPRVVDDALSEYLSYHEAEWSRYGYRPPDTCELAGSWRDREGKVFAFLLVETTTGSASGRHLTLYVAGERALVEQLGERIQKLKSSLGKLERKELQVIDAGGRLNREDTRQSVRRISAFLLFFTAAINAFSLYLRRLSPPEFPIVLLQHIYQLLVVTVHFAALLLLLLITVLGIGYVARYGLLILRRL